MTGQRPKLLITNNHEDYTGGGTYVMMIVNILKRYYDIYTDKNLDYYLNPNTPWRLAPGEIGMLESNMPIDLHLYADYHGWTPPLGKRNIQIIYYPLDKKIDGWDTFFVLNEFCLAECNRLWPGRGHIVTPYFDSNGFYILPKKKQAINVGHYFVDPDGHSKNQHHVIHWFRNQTQFETLVLHGKLTHPDYYNFLLELADHDPRIQLKYNRPQEEIRLDLAESMAMIHAIGYGRNSPAQTEHFGLVAVEALLSGCQPIVHNSGGCRDIPGVVVYNDFSEIRLINANPQALREIGCTFNEDYTHKQILKVLHE